MSAPAAPHHPCAHHNHGSGGDGQVLEARGARALRIWVLNRNVRARGFYAHLSGVPFAERPVSGWGGSLDETAYRWSDIRTLTRA